MDDCLHHIGIGYSGRALRRVPRRLSMGATLKLEPAVPYGKEKSAEADD